MIELTENMTDEEVRAGLIERADKAIGVRQQMERAERELKGALDEVATWLELSGESLMSLSRGGYFIGWVENAPDRWDMTITQEIPPEHIVLS